MTRRALAREAQETVGLVDRTEFVRLDATRRLNPERRGELGQFLTPPPVARFMASMFEARGEDLRLLDPGAGVGSLTAAFVEAVCTRRRPPKSLTVTACELDPLLCEYLDATLQDCGRAAAATATRFAGEVQPGDFIEQTAEALAGGLFAPAPRLFNCAILNPPYHKIRSDSRHRQLLSRLGIETSNLYTAFLAIVVRLLEPGGELVAITPRSFCNGTYFESFRKAFLRDMALVRLHTFGARDAAFAEDGVLQENLVMHARKPRAASRIFVSASAAPGAAGTSARRAEPTEVVRRDDPHQFIRLVEDDRGRAVAEEINSFHSSLDDLGISVSTGRVVDFRVARYLRMKWRRGAVPLIYPGHFADGTVHWPNPDGRKPNAVVVAGPTKRLLLPSGTYVLVKRFSSKEERRRVVAAIYDPMRAKTARVGFENHLNVFHRKGSGLRALLARGLARYLNSSPVDAYFRQFSGHTQVNAADLRSLRFPDEKQLEALGAASALPTFSQPDLDALVRSVLFRPPVSTTQHEPTPLKERIDDALGALRAFGLSGQGNERAALVLLALLDLGPGTPWSGAIKVSRGFAQINDFLGRVYGRRSTLNNEAAYLKTIESLVRARLVRPTLEPDSRTVGRVDARYEIEGRALHCLRAFKRGTLGRGPMSMARPEAFSVTLSPRTKVMLPGGEHGELAGRIIEEFRPRFGGKGDVVYVRVGEKAVHADETALADLGVGEVARARMPDLVVYDRKRDWLFLIETVVARGPVSARRHRELERLFRASRSGLIFVTAFSSRRAMVRYLGEISWETDVWVAEAPDHMIHFDGERFLGPA